MNRPSLTLWRQTSIQSSLCCHSGPLGAENKRPFVALHEVNYSQQRGRKREREEREDEEGKRLIDWKKEGAERRSKKERGGNEWMNVWMDMREWQEEEEEEEETGGEWKPKQA